MARGTERRLSCPLSSNTKAKSKKKNKAGK
jgi:hypothetical protein